jgi:hypothetical protein
MKRKKKQDELESLKKNQGALSTFFKTTISVPVCTEENTNEE